MNIEQFYDKYIIYELAIKPRLHATSGFFLESAYSNTPCCNNFFFSFSFVFFSPPSFPNEILKTTEMPSLCNVVSSIYQLFVPHFAIAVFMCIYWYYRIKQRWGTSFEFSSVLSTVDLSKH